MPVAPARTPFQELPDFVMAVNTPLVSPSSSGLTISASFNNGSVSASGAAGTAIKSKAFVLAVGPAVDVPTSTPTTVQNSYRIESVDLCLDKIAGNDANGFVNLLLIKVPRSVVLNGTVSNAFDNTNEGLVVADPYVAVTATTGPSVAASIGTNLWKTQLSAAAAGPTSLANLRADLTGDFVATTTANNVIDKKEEQLRLGPGERLVLIFIGSNNGRNGGPSGNPIIGPASVAQVLLSTHIV